MNKKITFLMAAAIMLLALVTQPMRAVGQNNPTILFHETFGNNPSSARDWHDSCSVKSGVYAVYSDVGSYTMSNLKQGKNTTGSTLSGINQSSSGTDAIFVSGPYNLSNYTSLVVKYQWKAGSIKGTYTTKLYYKTSASSTTWTEVSGTGTGATTFVERSYTLPTACQVSTLYFKVVFNTSNTQAIIDEFELTGIEVNTSLLATPSFDPDGGIYSSSQTVTISSEDGDDVNIYYTIDGSDPSVSTTAIEYTTPVTISDHTTLKAVATDFDEFSAVKTAEYKFLPTMGEVTPDNNPTYVYDNGQSFSWYVLSSVTTHGTTVTEKGFVYSTTNNAPTTSDTKIVVTSNDLEATLTGLTASTSYYVRSYAISEGQTVYSATATLTTPAFPSFDIQYVVNGEGYGDIVSVSGTIGTLPEPEASFIPEGYTFGGWSTDDATINIIDGTYVPTGDMFLYAVLSITESGTPTTFYQKVTSNLSDWSGEYLIVYETDEVAFDGSRGISDPKLDAGNNVIDVIIDENDQIDSNSTNDASTFIVESIENSDKYSIKSKSGYYIGRTDSGNGLEAQTSVLANSISYDTDDECVYIQGYKDNTGYNYLKFNNTTGVNNYRFRYYAQDKQQNIQLYKKTTVTPSVTNNYTLVKDVTTTETKSNIYSTYKITVKNNGVLTLTGTNSGTAANLIIEDGGQLITSSTDVQATVKKAIAAHGATTADGGWNFIASPINSNSLDPATTGLGMITDNLGNGASETTATYDLYKFVENPTDNDKEWKNYRNATFNLANGQGYLYASKEGTTLNFTGSINPCNQNVEVNLDFTTGAEFAGWNLVGNPFTFNAYVNRSYYKMNGDGSAILADVQASGTTIAPCMGIMVHVGQTGQSVTFSKEPIVNAPSNGNVSIAVVQANERGTSTTTVDKAIVSFNEGSELPKFYFGNPNAKLYIPQNGKEYAIVSAEAQGELPLNFRAAENGTYTLTVNPEGVEMNYLHLIDNMTGANVDLLSTPSYTFTAKTTDYESRFRLVFAANNENGVSAGSTTFVYYSNGNWMVNNEGEATLQVIDVMGRVLSNQTISGTAELSLNQQPGVYVLRLVNGNDVKTQKIVVR